jgi:hypothetical protein
VMGKLEGGRSGARDYQRLALPGNDLVGLPRADLAVNETMPGTATTVPDLVASPVTCIGITMDTGSCHLNIPADPKNRRNI